MELSTATNPANGCAMRAIGSGEGPALAGAYAPHDASDQHEADLRREYQQSSHSRRFQPRLASRATEFNIVNDAVDAGRDDVLRKHELRLVRIVHAVALGLEAGSLKKVTMMLSTQGLSTPTLWPAAGTSSRTVAQILGDGAAPFRRRNRVVRSGQDQGWDVALNRPGDQRRGRRQLPVPDRHRRRAR